MRSLENAIIKGMIFFRCIVIDRSALLSLKLLCGNLNTNNLYHHNLKCSKVHMLTANNTKRVLCPRIFALVRLLVLVLWELGFCKMGREGSWSDLLSDELRIGVVVGVEVDS